MGTISESEENDNRGTISDIDHAMKKKALKENQRVSLLEPGMFETYDLGPLNSAYREGESSLTPKLSLSKKPKQQTFTAALGESKEYSRSSKKRT